jgi:hypothetical protein
MRILITNLVLAGRSGTELLVEQTADWLRRAGHIPVIYSPVVGETGQKMRERGHLVFDRIGHVQVRPDVIHGHQCAPTMTALAAFPSVPAIFVSHSAESEYDRPPFHPQIRKYFSASEFLREFWASTTIPFSRFEVLGNPVDIETFPLRSSLPARPITALHVAKYESQIEVVRRACTTRNLTLEEVGHGVRNIQSDLSSFFQRADIVFASGRSAMEATASGCAVILTEGSGTYGLVRANAVDDVVGLNWGIRLLAQRPTEKALVEAIDQYDAVDAAAVAARVRERCSLDTHGRRLVSIYQVLIGSGTSNAGDGQQAIAEFLEAYVPSLGSMPWRTLARCFGGPYVPSVSVGQSFEPEQETEHLRNELNRVTIQNQANSDRLEREIQNLRLELDLTKNSTSWKILAPLRHAKNWIRPPSI